MYLRSCLDQAYAVSKNLKALFRLLYNKQILLSYFCGYLRANILILCAKCY